MSTSQMKNLLKTFSSKINSVHLSKTNPLDLMFFDQMKIASQLQLAPKIQLVSNQGPSRTIYFDNLKYLDLYHPPFTIIPDDQHKIQQLFYTLFLHHTFFPKTPYLGYQIIPENKKRQWYLWSYTPIDYLRGKQDLLDKYYEHSYHKVPLFDSFVTDYLLRLYKHFK